MTRTVRSPLLRLALSTALALLGAAAYASPADSVEKELEKAQRHLGRQDYQNACRAYQRADELAQGKSVPSLIGLVDCYQRVKDGAKAVATARQAVAAAANAEEKTKATRALGLALLHQPDETSWNEAADLFKGEMTGRDEAEGAKGLLTAWIVLHREQEATDLLRSLRARGEPEDDIQQLLCGVTWGDATSEDSDEIRKADARNDFLRKIDPEAPLRSGGKVKRPEIRSQTKPEMPAEARKHHTNGTVVVQAVIDAQGRVRNAKVLQGAPDGLTESALRAVQDWTFSPATLDGAPVPVCYVLSVSYKVG